MTARRKGSAQVESAAKSAAADLSHKPALCFNRGLRGGAANAACSVYCRTYDEMLPQAGLAVRLEISAPSGQVAAFAWTLAANRRAVLTGCGALASAVLL